MNKTTGPATLAAVKLLAMGLFDTAKKWVNTEGQKLLTADRRKAQALEAQQYQNERQLERDAGEQVLRTLAPGLFDKLDRHQAGAAQREQERIEQRLAAADDAEVDLRFEGDVSGGLQAVLALFLTRSDDDLVVVLEARDPLTVGGEPFHALQFAVAGSSRTGVIDAGGPSFEATEYQLHLGESEEGLFWHESYGPGRFEFLADDLLRLDLVHGGAGGQTVRVEGTVRAAWR